MRTIKVVLAYDGTDYGGWQSQINTRTLQDTFEAAVQRISGEQLRVTSSGRTDAGVHALGQVVSFLTQSALPAETWQRALNAELPNGMCARSVHDAPPEFHARSDAKRKRYLYQIQNGPLRDVFQLRYAWQVYHPLDAEVMHRAAQVLVGTHDFISFQSSGAERETTVRTVFEATIRQGRGGGAGEKADGNLHMEESRAGGEGAKNLTFEIEADGFLYNMVRTIVGSLVQIGRGLQPENWLAEILAARDRRVAGQTAPPQGLFLVHVVYD